MLVAQQQLKGWSMGKQIVTRRRFVQSIAGGAAAAGILTPRLLAAAAPPGADTPGVERFVARTPPGFYPWSAPGRVVKVAAKSSFSDIMQPNQLWPKEDVARRLLERAMMDLTGAPTLVEAMKKFIHKDDVVAIKPNGIAGQKGATMAVNFELILPVVEAVLAVGVPAERVTVYEQYPTYLVGCRVNAGKWKLPDGVKTTTHNNRDMEMPPVRIYQGIPTRYCRTFTDATAVIDMTMIKDHGICGYTGTMKNITHGNVNNPQDHHAHAASPQIAMLYNHPIVTSRVRLHITDAFKIMDDRGPLDRDPRARIAHGAVYVATDPVAMDAVGWDVVEASRKQRRLPTLTEARREPRYIRTAADLGLGVLDRNQIRLTSVEV